MGGVDGDKGDFLTLDGQELKELQASVDDLLSAVSQLLNDPFG